MSTNALRRTVNRDDLSDRLEREGSFEIYRGRSDGERSAMVWLTEAERDEIVSALRECKDTKFED